MAETLRFVLRTPHEIVLDEPVASARVPVATGTAGLRPLQEPIVLVVEPGLVVLRQAGGLRFAATAGGLLEGDRAQATLLTPFAATGASDRDVLDALDTALTTPGTELEARRRLGELERRIVHELRDGAPRPPERSGA